MAARSSFFMLQTAANIRSRAGVSPEAIIPQSARGTICQETPKRSLTQPQASASGTAESADHEPVDLGLVLAADHQRHRLVEGGVGLGAVHRHDRLAVDAELGVHDRAGGVLAAAVVAVDPVDASAPKTET